MMICDDCKGTGVEVCPFCYGLGCEKCDNKGKIKCWECKGTGELGEHGATLYPLIKRPLESESNVICRDCGGEGVEVCYKCFSKGCDYCNGGYVSCYSCGGTGKTGKYGPTIEYQKGSDLFTVAALTFVVCLSIYSCMKSYSSTCVSPSNIAFPDKVKSQTLHNGSPLWRHAELKTEEIIHNLKPEFSDMKWQAQKISHTQGTRLDLWGYKYENGSRYGVVVDSKYVDRLTRDYFDQLNNYARHPFYAKEKIIICRQDTIVPSFFKNSSIEIHKILPRPDEFISQLRKG